MRALQKLSARERLLLVAVLPLVLLLAGWRLAWVPLSDLREAREAEVAGYRLVAEEASRAEAQPAAPAAEAAPLAARVTESAEEAGLALTRLEPEGERLRVVVAEAGFSQVVLWLADLEEARGATVAALELDRRTLPGAVSARVLLEEAP